MHSVTLMPEEMGILTHVIIQDVVFALQSESGVIHWGYIQTSDGRGNKSTVFVLSLEFLWDSKNASLCKTDTGSAPFPCGPGARMDGVK